MNIKTVVLSTPIRPTPARPPITELTFREPKFNDYFELGDPRVPVVVENRVYFQPVQGIVKAYAERLLQGSDLNYLALLNLKDSREVEFAILGFFQDAERPTTSDASPETSSSN